MKLPDTEATVRDFQATQNHSLTNLINNRLCNANLPHGPFSRQLR